MNLVPVAIENIPVGTPLPWRIYDRNGYILFSRGEIVSTREQLENLQAGGLLRDLDAQPQNHETGDWAEFREVSPPGGFPPPGVQPQIGEMVQLLLPNQTPHRYYVTHLIGYIRKRSILVTRPTGNTFIPQEGELVEVRMVTGSNIYAFRAAIQRFCISPVPYMHLDYPLQVRVQKLRKSPWARVNLGVSLTDAQGGHEAARLVNLSPEGGQLHASANLGKAGSKLQISLTVSFDALISTLHLDATILHVNPAIEANLLEYGVHFENVAAADAIWLNALVYRHIAEGDAR